MKKIRCFVAINFPPEIIKEIEKVQKEIGSKEIFQGKFIKGENLHLTLKFLREIDESEVEEVKKKLKGIKQKKFEAEINSIGIFSEKFIKIIWLHITNCDELQKEIDNKLKDLFEPEKRFMSHLTIARVKNVKDRKLFLDELGKVKVQNLKFGVDRFYLVKSELKPTGPEYSVLGEYSLE